jgi:hypothetical protein
MSTEMRNVLEIAGAGMVLLFAALGALVTLMYLLTNPSIFGEPARERRRARRRARRMKKRGQVETPAAPETRETRLEEHDRRRRAAALAVAIARAERDTEIVVSRDVAPEWRLMHRQLRLHQAIGRVRAGFRYDMQRGSRQ